MLSGFSILLVFQLAGELLSRSLALPIPGPVFGMVLLLGFLIWRGNVPDSLRSVSEGILRHLALLYVPAGVGLIAHSRLLASDWIAIVGSLLVSTVLTLIVTALVLQMMQRRGDAGRE